MKETESESVIPVLTADTFRSPVGLPVHTERFPGEIEKVLAQVVPDEWLDILPTGEIYLPQVHYRAILNEAFGPGQWTMQPLGLPVVANGWLSVHYGLFVKGYFVAEACGEHQLGYSSLATSIESAKSNALMRCCKDLGVAAKCWQKSFCDWFRDSFCYQDGKDWKRKGKTGKPLAQINPAEPAVNYFFTDAPQVAETAVAAAPEASAPVDPMDAQYALMEHVNNWEHPNFQNARAELMKLLMIFPESEQGPRLKVASFISRPGNAPSFIEHPGRLMAKGKNGYFISDAWCLTTLKKLRASVLEELGSQAPGSDG